MITSQREYLGVEHRLRLLANRLDYLQCQKSASTFEIAQLRLRVQELKGELREYDDLMMRRALVKLPHNMHEVPQYLMKRRLKTGLSQADFARLLGIDRRMLRTYEANMYRGMRLMQVIDLDRVLIEIEREFPDSRFLELVAEAERS
jgi:hypothetical protein